MDIRIVRRRNLRVFEISGFMSISNVIAREGNFYVSILNQTIIIIRDGKSSSDSKKSAKIESRDHNLQPFSGHSGPKSL